MTGGRPAAADVDRDELRLLDALAAAGHPSLEVAVLDGWVMRAAGGVTKRANSAWPRDAGTGTAALEVVATTAWYRERGLVPRVQAVAAAEPAGLEPALAEAGWTPGDDVLVLTGPLAPLLTAAEPPSERVAVAVSPAPDAAWAAVAAATSGRPPRAEATALALAAAAGPRPAFAVVSETGRPGCAGRPVAVGRGVVDAEHLGVFGLAVLPDARGRGHARRVLAALARHAAGAGADRVFLQVAADNAAALRLYARLGLAERYRYRYWTAPG